MTIARIMPANLVLLAALAMGIARAEEPAAAEAAKEHAPRTIAGVVIDGTGEPIAGALIQWGYIYDPPEKWSATKTDARGHYRLDVRDFGVDYRLGVSAAGMAPQWQVPRASWWGSAFDLPRDRDVPPPKTADFQLEPEHRITGFVVDEQGVPIEGVTVTAETAVTGFISSFSMPSPAMQLPGEHPTVATSGEDGAFTLSGLPDEKVCLTISSPHRFAQARNYPVDEDATIKMSGSGRPGVVRFKVVDGGTGRPVPDFTVVGGHDPVPTVIHDKAGRFELAAELTEGDEYLFYVYREEYAPAAVEIEALPQDCPETATVKLWAGEPLRARLVDGQTGKPLPDVPILYGIVPKGSSKYMDWNQPGHHCVVKVQRATGNAEGHFAFSEKPGGSDGVLFVITPGYGRLILKPADRPAVGDDGRIVVKLTPEALIAGTLVRDGRPVAGVKVSVSGDWPESKDDFREEIEWPTTDAEGRFRVGCLRPGTYYVGYRTHPSRSVESGETIATVTLAVGEQKVLAPVTIGETDR